MMIFLCLFMSVALLVVSISFWNGKALNHIKDYKNTSEEEKKNIRKEPLCKNIAFMFFIFALIFFAAGVSVTFRNLYLTKAMLFWVIVTFIDIYYIERKRIYNKT